MTLLIPSAISKTMYASILLNWKLGGEGDDFSLTEPRKFSVRHYVHISPHGMLTVFDNGTVMLWDGPNPFVNWHITRVVEYKLDENTYQLLPFNEYSVPSHYGFCHALGSGNGYIYDCLGRTTGW